MSLYIYGFYRFVIRDCDDIDKEGLFDLGWRGDGLVIPLEKLHISGLRVEKKLLFYVIIHIKIR